MSLAGLSSFQDWAEYLTGLVNETVSKTAIWKRANKNLLACVDSILKKAINSQLEPHKINIKKEGSLSHFTRVLLQDSTTIQLPNLLAQFYKGNTSKGKQKSVLRIQLVHDLLTGGFQTFSLSSFTENDQGAAPGILKIIRQGDLVIRDLGYFVIKVFKNIAAAGGFFLTRFKYGCHIYSPVTGEKIELIDLLKGNMVDVDILLGAKEKFGCRMIAVKLPEKVANERRRKAKNDRDKRLNHSKEYMELLGWAIFFTNVKSDTWDYKTVIQIYKIRWHIEIIFKGWKSHFNIDKLIPEIPKKGKVKNEDIERYKIRVETVIYMVLIYITLFHLYFYINFLWKIYNCKRIVISYLKVFSFVKKHIHRIISSHDWQQFEKELIYFTAYEKRNKRENHLDLYLKLITNG